MALTGSGNITLTDPITGNQVTVPAIAGMAKASDLNALAKLTGGNKLDGSQVITSSNAGFILGKNSDLALLKKTGARRDNCRWLGNTVQGSAFKSDHCVTVRYL